MVRHTYMMWQPEVNLGWHSSGAVYLGFMKQALLLGWNLYISLDGLASSPQGSYTRALELQTQATCLNGSLGLHSRPSYLPSPKEQSLI